MRLYEDAADTSAHALYGDAAGLERARGGDARHYAGGRSYLRAAGGVGEGGLLVQLHDITDLERARRELEAYQAELRKLASEVSLAEERERRRISTELHDGAVQNLGLARIRLGSISRKIDDPALTEDVSGLRDLLSQSVRELRSLMSELSPPMLYELGLPPALEWLAGRFEEQYDLACTLALPARRPVLGDEVTVLLFQAARELLMNVVKHAEASEARIGLSVESMDGTKHADSGEVNDSDPGEARWVALRISDNGVGIDPSRLLERPSDTGGFGLFSIRERTEHLGGRFEAARLTAGTEVTLRLPTTGAG